MSKAFTKETDADDDDDLDVDAGIPGGFTNYITPAGYQRLGDELARLDAALLEFLPEAGIARRGT